MKFQKSLLDKRGTQFYVMAPDPSCAHQPLHRTMPLCPKSCHLLKKQSRNVQLWKMMSQTHQNFQSYKCYDISFFSLCEKQPLMWKQIYSWNILMPTKLGTRLKFSSKIFGCGENERQSSEILNATALIDLRAQWHCFASAPHPHKYDKENLNYFARFLTRLDFSILLLIALHPKRL